MGARAQRRDREGATPRRRNSRRRAQRILASARLRRRASRTSKKRGEHYYNFWKDAEHPRGLWRRTTLAEYRKAEPEWETVLDLDALGGGRRQELGLARRGLPQARRTSAAWSRCRAAAPTPRSCASSTSTTKAFVEGRLHAARGEEPACAGSTRTRIYVGTDFGPGSMTKSGYPRIVKEWKRGTPLAPATTVFEGKADDVAVSAVRDLHAGLRARLRRPRASTSTRARRSCAARTASLRRSTCRTTPTVESAPRVAADPAAHRRGPSAARPTPAARCSRRTSTTSWPASASSTVLFTPTDTTSLGEYSLDAASPPARTCSTTSTSRLDVLTPAARRVEARAARAARRRSARVDARRRRRRRRATTIRSPSPSFLTPTTLLLGTLGKGNAPSRSSRRPAFFDAEGFDVEQHFAASKDGTRIPYFQVAPQGPRSSTAATRRCCTATAASRSR